MSVGREDNGVGASARTATYRDNGTYRADTYRTDTYRTDTYRADGYRADMTTADEAGQPGSTVGPGPDNTAQNAHDLVDTKRVYGTGGTYRVDTYRTDTTYRNDRLRSDASIRNDTTYGAADRNTSGISARGDVRVGQNSNTATYQPAPSAGVTARTDINTNTTRTQINQQPDASGIRAQGQAQVGDTGARADIRTDTRTDIRTDTTPAGVGQPGSAVGPGAGNTVQNSRDVNASAGTDTGAQIQGQAQIASDRAAGLVGTGPLTPADFVTTAASAGLFEVESSKLALQKSQDQTVKDFAQRMIDDHTKAADRLKAIATQKNIPVPTEMLPQHKAQLDMLKNLNGTAFDRAYHDAQVRAHDEAVSLFDRASKSLSDNDLKSFASDTLPTLKDHDNMAKHQLHGGDMPGNK
jgi:putative membrane protein